jgi:PIN domain nuclease of toxin-antitoxin system
MPSAVSGRLLLDTHALIWLMSGEELSEAARRSIDKSAVSASIWVSPIAAWEIASPVRRGRIVLSLSPDSWFDAVLKTGIQLAPMPPRTLIASASLPGDPPADPADRILAATARTENLILVTRDTGLLEYAGSGHLRALPC